MIQFKKIKAEHPENVVKVEVDTETVVCELALTRPEVQTLQWVLTCWLAQYETNEGSFYKTHAKNLHEVLEEA